MKKYVCILIVLQYLSTLLAFGSSKIGYNSENLQEKSTSNTSYTEVGDKKNDSTLTVAISISVLLNVCCLFLVVSTKNKQLKKNKTIQLLEKEIDFLRLFKINNTQERKVSSEKDLCKFGQLDKLMRLDKFYLNPSCNRETLLAALDIDKNTLSELLKKYGFDNLPDYINRFRLEEAIKLLNNEGNTTSIDQIAKQAGFGTSRSLQRQFKDKYNISPNEYRKCFSKNKNVVDIEHV